MSKSISSEPNGCTLTGSSGSQLVVVGDDDGNFYKLDARTSDTIFSYDFGDDRIMDSVISSDGTKMACISDDGNLYTISPLSTLTCPTCPPITTAGIIGYAIAGIAITCTVLMIYLYNKKR
jgi:WD40 repeat protein